MAAGTHDQAAADHLDALAAVFGDLLQRYSSARAVDQFLAEPRAWVERLDRFAALRTFEVLANLPSKPLPRPRWIPDDPNCRFRVLRPLEIGLVRLVSLADDRHATIIAMCDVTAGSGELVGLDSSRFGLDASGMATSVSLPGTSVVVARDRVVPAWAKKAVTKTLLNAQDGARPCGAPVLYEGKSEDASKIQSSLIMIINKVLAAAGLGDDGTVTPKSIRNTAGRSAYDAEGFEAAVKACGVKVGNWDDFRFDIGTVERRPVRVRKAT